MGDIRDWTELEGSYDAAVRNAERDAASHPRADTAPDALRERAVDAIGWALVELLPGRIGQADAHKSAEKIVNALALLTPEAPVASAPAGEPSDGA